MLRQFQDLATRMLHFHCSCVQSARLLLQQFGDCYSRLGYRVLENEITARWLISRDLRCLAGHIMAIDAGLVGGSMAKQ